MRTKIFSLLLFLIVPGQLFASNTIQTITVFNDFPTTVTMGVVMTNSTYPAASLYQNVVAPGGVATFTLTADQMATSGHLVAQNGAMFLANTGANPQTRTWSATPTFNGANFNGFTISPSSFFFSMSGTNGLYTNILIKISNNLSGPATATWTWNGLTVKQETLSAGQSDTWLSPRVQIAPNPENYSFTTGLQLNTGGIGFGSDGSPQFGPGAGGGTSSGSGSGGGAPTVTGSSGSGSTSVGTTGGTNAVTFNSGTNTDVIRPPTNNIIWQAPSGSASESTLQAVGSLLHQDNLNNLAGLSILHNDLQSINGNTISFTNELGQVITAIYQATNIDGMMLSTLKTISTNLTGTNVATVNFPTNLSLSLTNYASETTLQGISNALAGTNFSFTAPDTNSVINEMSNAYASGFNEASNAIGGFTTNVEIINLGGTNIEQVISQSFNASPEYSTAEMLFSNVWSGLTQLDVDDDYGDPDMTFDMSPYVPSGLSSHFKSMLTGGGPSLIMDFNPLHSAGGAAVFSAVKQLWTWGLAMAYLIKCSMDAWRIVQLLNETHGGRPKPATIAKVISD